MFAWLRPGNLIWNYRVNNYLLGQRPPAFDVLFWNADTTRMPARLHADFVDLAMDNKLVTPGALPVMDTPVDLSRIGTDSYLVAGIADHTTPWQNCYRSTQPLGGTSRSVLSTSGHIAALVNPPGNPKATYQASDNVPASTSDWLEAPRRKGEAGGPTWWRGSATAAARTSHRQLIWAGTDYGRLWTPRVPTCSTPDTTDGLSEGPRHPVRRRWRRPAAHLRPRLGATPIPGIARTVGRMLDALGYDRVHVLGVSLGGIVA